MALSKSAPRLAALAVAAAGIWFLLQFVASVDWRVRAEASRLPCTLRPGSVAQFFLRVSQSGLTGLSLEFLPGRNLPDLRLDLVSVPEGAVLATARLMPRRGELFGRFPPLNLAPMATVQGRISAGAEGTAVLLNCRPVPGPGVPQERPVMYRYHALGSSAHTAFVAWLDARVAPVLPPGAALPAVLLLAAVPLLAASAVWAVSSPTGTHRAE
ncbi:MAG: hypothetical protein MUE60_06385 [Candidatus Eisenbacteria bacterium]|jgi:hypothetical protein|nr:hypothetical protein [Candidatus Eisenbacteria bacterium]